MKYSPHQLLSERDAPIASIGIFAGMYFRGNNVGETGCSGVWAAYQACTRSGLVPVIFPADDPIYSIDKNVELLIGRRLCLPQFLVVFFMGLAHFLYGRQRRAADRNQVANSRRILLGLLILFLQASADKFDVPVEPLAHNL